MASGYQVFCWIGFCIAETGFCGHALPLDFIVAKPWNAHKNAPLTGEAQGVSLPISGGDLPIFP